VHSSAMWPTPRAPISTTSASVSSAAFTSVSGTPSSLLNEPTLADVRQRTARATASRSLTLVLPTDPVSRTQRSLSLEPAHAARRAPAPGQGHGEQVLDAGLAHGPGDAHHAFRQAGAGVATERAKRLHRAADPH